MLVRALANDTFVLVLDLTLTPLPLSISLSVRALVVVADKQSITEFVIIIRESPAGLGQWSLWLGALGGLRCRLQRTRPSLWSSFGRRQSVPQNITSVDEIKRNESTGLNFSAVSFEI